MQFFCRVSALWIWIFLVWTLTSSPKVCAYRWTSYKSLRQNQSDSSENWIVDPSQNEVQIQVQVQSPKNEIEDDGFDNQERHKTSEDYPVSLRREWLEGGDTSSSSDDSYPSFQDFLDRFSEVGIGYIFRDTVTAFLAKGREEQELSGSLAKVGVIAYALKTLGEYGSISGLVDKESGSSLVRFSRYLGFGVFMLGTTKDYFMFFEDTQCLINGYKAHAHAEGLRSTDYTNSENSHSHSQPHFHEGFKAQESQVISISRSPEAQERNHVLLHSCSEKTDHELNILKSVASIAAAVFSYLHPEYAELLAYGEAGMEGLSFFYRQAQDGEGDLLKRMGLPGDFFSIKSLEKFVQHL